MIQEYVKTKNELMIHYQVNTKKSCKIFNKFEKILKPQK